MSGWLVRNQRIMLVFSIDSAKGSGSGAKNFLLRFQKQGRAGTVGVGGFLMSMRIAAVIHDGQADAMPCQCPACVSPFINTNHRRGRMVFDFDAGRVVALPAPECRNSTVSA